MAEVRLIDSGKPIVDTPTNALLRLNEKFRDYPAQAVDVRIANLVPVDCDDEWDKNSMRNVTEWLQEALAADNVHVEGRILWSEILDIIWLDKLNIVTQLSIRSKVNNLLMHRNLLKKKIAIEDYKCLEVLQASARACRIFDEKELTAVAEQITTHENVESSDCTRTEMTPPPAHAHAHHGSRLSVNFKRSTTSQSSSSISSMRSLRPLKNNTSNIADDFGFLALPLNQWSVVSILNFFSPNFFFVQFQS